MLVAGLTAYTLLLAATAWFLIRYGKLWQDVRSLLLVVVLLLLGTSVNFDRLLAEQPRLGIPLAVGGLVFAVALSAALIRGIRLRLPVGFRLPYYAILALFFLYPVLVSHWVSEPDRPALLWSLFGFSTVAAILFLTLLPAIRRGPAYLADNGSPWPWPYYPWSLFVILVLAMCWRAHNLCLSLHGVVGSQTIFDPYFLVPFLWAINYLLLELGLVSKHKPTICVAMLLPLGILVMGFTDSPQVAALGFLRTFHKTLGASPLFLTVLSIAALYAIAWRAASAGHWWESSRRSRCCPSMVRTRSTSTPSGALTLGPAWRSASRS